MFEYTINIPQEYEAGITAARAEYNAALSLAEGQVVEDHPDYKATNQAYIEFVMTSAAISYTQRYV